MVEPSPTSRPSPRWAGFVADAWHQVRHPWIPTMVAVLVILAATFAIFATTGQAVAGQLRTLDRLNAPEGRLVTLTDATGSAGLDARSVTTIESIPGVEWALGVGPAVDVTNATLRGSGSAPARLIYGNPPPVLRMSTTRPPGPGDALASAERLTDLGLLDGIGPVTGGGIEALVIGSFTAQPPLTRLQDEVLVHSPDPNGPLLKLYVSVEDVNLLANIAPALRSVTTSADPAQLVIETSPELTRLSADLTIEMARQARSTLLGLLGTVSLLVSALQFGRVSSASRDIGRRRALGASRSLVIAQILVNGLLTGLTGAALGAAAGLILNGLVAGTLPGPTFTLAVITLVTLASVLAAVPPAIRAARIDPVRILRVP